MQVNKHSPVQVFSEDSMSLRAKRILFAVLLLDFISGLTLLYFTGPVGSSLTGFVASLCIVSGLLGIAFILIVRTENRTDNPEDV